jgi:hypothetical protein
MKLYRGTSWRSLRPLSLHCPAAQRARATRVGVISWIGCGRPARRGRACRDMSRSREILRESEEHLRSMLSCSEPQGAADNGGGGPQRRRMRSIDRYRMRGLQNADQEALKPAIPWAVSRQ